MPRRAAALTVPRRAAVGIAVLVLVVLAAVVLWRGAPRDPVSPFVVEDPGTTRFAQAADTTAVGLGGVCAPDAQPVTIRSVEPFGVSGSFTVTGFATEGDRVFAECDVDDPQPLSIDVRLGSESASAEGVRVTYEVGGDVRTERLTRPITLCRQLSEC